MKDLAFLTSPDMSKAEVVTNHVVIAEYAGLNRISMRKLIDNNKQDLEALGILSFEIHSKHKYKNSTRSTIQCLKMILTKCHGSQTVQKSQRKI